MWSGVVALRPANSRARVILGAAYREQGRAEEAATHLREAVRLAPQFDLAYAHLFEFLFEEGNFQEALAATKEWLQRNPDSPIGYGNLGRLYWEKWDQGGRDDLAARNFTEAIRRRPQMAFPRYNRAGIALVQGDTADAVIEGRVLQAGDRQWQQKANLQARRFLLKDDPMPRDVRRALFDARLACLDIQGVEASHLDTLAMAYALSGRYPDAVKTVQEAVRRADASNQASVARQMRQRLNLYRSGRAFRYNATGG
jgi:Flp pilus assembly protein TadD